MLKCTAPLRGRFFVVGCPRSGTTLLQTLLAAHPAVASFPESWFFVSIVGYLTHRLYGSPHSKLRQTASRQVREVRSRLGIADPEGRSHVQTFLRQVGHEELISLFPSAGRGLWPQLRAAIRILDALAVIQEKPCWVEKTPLHLGYLDYIERTVPDPRVIHVVRSGPDVVASLYDAARRYPDPWGRTYPSLEQCIRQWNHCVFLSRRVLGKKNHMLVRYEDLVRDPLGTLRDVCTFLGIEYYDTILDSRLACTSLVVRSDEEWKANCCEPIRDMNGTKFQKLFDESERRWILERLAPLYCGERGVQT